MNRDEHTLLMLMQALALGEQRLADLDAERRRLHAELARQEKWRDALKAVVKILQEAE